MTNEFLGSSDLDQIPEDTIGVDRRLVGLEPRAELGRGTGFALRISSSMAGGLRPPVGPQLVDQRLQRQLGVADHGVPRLVGAVDVERVHRALHDGLLVRVRDGVAEAAGEETRADREQQVAPAQEVIGQRAAHADGQRVVLREDALGLERGQHRHLGRLRELQQLGRRVGIADALADVEQGILGGEQRLDGRLDVVRIGPGAPALHRRVGMLVLVVLAQIARDQQQHRAGPPGAQVREGAAHVLGDEVGAVDLAHPLGDRLERLGHVEVGVAARARRPGPPRSRAAGRSPPTPGRWRRRPSGCPPR